jgi:hypothetical protein
VTTPSPGNAQGPDAQDPGSGLPVPGSGRPEPVAGPEVDAVVVVPVVTPVPAAPPEPRPVRVIDMAPTTADDIAALVLAVPDVVRLHAGRFGEVATYLPGRRITGIKLGTELIEVHVVVAGRVPVRETAQLIHAAVATSVATPVHVYIQDVAAT